MEDIFFAEDGATPLAQEEKNGLKLGWIRLRSELNEAEAQNIAQAVRYLALNPPKDILNETFLLRLHKRMFGAVWEWAGTFRTTERNLGVAPYQIPIKLHALFDDVAFWREHAVYPPQEIAVRLHHKLVAIHPFPNGNGRISRLMADTLLRLQKLPPLYWGNANLVHISMVRNQYIAALRKADGGDYTDLLSFVSGEKR